MAQEPTKDWQPIETAPKDGTWVIGYIEGYVRSVHLKRYDPPLDGETEWWVDEDGCRMLDPTHWMPLPDPPKEADV